MTTNPALQRILEGILWSEDKSKYTQETTGNKRFQNS